MSNFSAEHAIELKSKLDYRKFYRQFLELSGYGEWLHAHCPFHEDKNPSFCIHEKTGIWHCKSDAKCGRGDAISFYQKITGKSFDEAIMDMANSQDIKIEISEEYKKKLEKKKQIFQLNNYVANLYVKSLAQCKDAQKYLIDRSFDLDTIKKFKIGYIPNYKLTEIGEGILPFLEYSGLSYPNGNNYFSNRRISIPFMDATGNIVGFSSRTIDIDVKPKYHHSRNNEIFDKSELLFGYHLAKDKIKETKSVLLVDGQIDSIRAHQYGISNCVAMCGLSISDSQLKILNGVKNFYIVLDDDKAENAIDTLYEKITSVNYYANIKIIKLYSGKVKCDLDDFLIKHGKGALLEKIKSAHSYNEYKLIDSINNISYKTIEDKKNHVYKNRKYIIGIKNAIDRNQYIELLSNKLEIPENDIRRVICRAEVEDSLVSKSYDENKDNRIYVSQLYILASFFANNFEIPVIYDCLKYLKVKNKLQNKFKKIFEKICDVLLTNGNNCDIINILYSSNVLNEDELGILVESFAKHDDLDYLEDRDELVAFLRDQLENLR